MKKFLFIFAFMFSMFCSECFAQTQWYKTTAYAFANVYNGRYQWGNWQSSNVNISINLDTDVITVYSPRTQIYEVYGTYNNGNAYTDSSGGNNVKFYVLDQDGDRGEIRLRIENNGNSQIYVDFSNCAWVYNVVRTR